MSTARSRRDDLPRAQTCYREVLGFAYEPRGEDMGLLRAPDSEGIDGDLHQRGPTPHPTVVFTVARIEDTVEAAVAHGGELLGPIQAMGEKRGGRICGTAKET